MPSFRHQRKSPDNRSSNRPNCYLFIVLFFNITFINICIIHFVTFSSFDQCVCVRAAFCHWHFVLRIYRDTFNTSRVSYQVFFYLFNAYIICFWPFMAPNGLCCADGSLRNYLLTLRYKPGLVQAGSSKPLVSDTNRLFNWYQLTGCDVVSNAVSSVLCPRKKRHLFIFCPVFGRCHRILLP